jgi:hypothetical protein
MNPGDFTHGGLHYSHSGTLGITKRALVESGIPQNVADKLFQGPMTIHLNVTGDVLQLQFGSINGNMRLFGD